MKYIVSIVSLIALILPLNLKAEQDYAIEWADTFNTNEFDQSRGVAVDYNGYVYASYNASPPVIVKYDSWGNEVLLDTVGMHIIDIDVDNNGNIYVLGSNLNINILAKYNTSGQIVWSRTLDTLSSGNAIAVDNSGNVYVAGSFSNGSDFDYLMIEYSSSGDLLRSVTYDYRGGNDIAYDVAVEGYHAYITGEAYNGSNEDCITLIYNLRFDEIVGVDVIDHGHRGPVRGDHGMGIAVDSSGHVYVTGYYANGTDYDWFTDKYNKFSSGWEKIWERTFGGSGLDYAYDITVDKDGYIYITGTGSSNNGQITLKYDPSGNLVWADSTAPIFTHGIAVDRSGNIYIKGSDQYNSILTKYVVNYDIGLSSIATSDSIYPGQDYTPAVWVKNNSYNRTITGIQLTANIDSEGVHIYTSQRNVGSLLPGDSVSVSFDTWAVPFHTDTFNLIFSIRNQDMNPDNNARSSPLYILDIIDAALLSIASSDTAYIDSTYTPAVWLKNNSYGTTLNNLNVLANIDSDGINVYTDQRTITSLSPGDSILVSFFPWTAPSHSGTFTLKFFILTDNANPDNDTISKPLYVVDFIDAALLSIASKDTAFSNNPYTPAVWLKNNSSETTLNNLRISASIDSNNVSIYFETVTVSSISPGDSILVSFDAWTPPSHSGTFTLSFSIPPDGNTDNNTKSKYLYVSDIDAALLSIASKDTVDMDSVYVPEVLVGCNYSNPYSYYTVYIQATIDSAGIPIYSSQRSVHFGGLPKTLKGNTIVSFDPWTAPSHPGAFSLKFSILNQNANPDNDTISKPLYVGDFIDAALLSIVSKDTVGMDSTYTPLVWLRNNSYGTVLNNIVISATIDSDNVHIYQGEDTVSGVSPGDSILLSFPQWRAPSHTDTFMLEFTILSEDMDPKNDTISKPLYIKDLTPPVIDSAIAYDGSNPVNGIDDDDYVIIYFSEPTNKPSIDSSNIDSILCLSNGHTWLDGSGNIGDCLWSSDGRQLRIEFTTTGASLPTISVHDTIFPDSSTIKDLSGNPCTSWVILEGSFYSSGIQEKTIKKTFLNVSEINRGALTIEYGTKGTGDYRIEIYGIDGRRVRSVKGKGEGYHRVRITDLPSGVYFVRLRHNDVIIIKKVMINR